MVDMLQEYPMVGRIPPNTPAFLPLYLGRQDYTALMSLIPVTILTGFLGSGKTTLLKRVLTEAHGLVVANGGAWFKPVVDRLLASLEANGVKLAGGRLVPDAQPNAPREDEPPPPAHQAFRGIAVDVAVDTDTNRYAKVVEVSKRVRWDIDADVIRGRFDGRRASHFRDRVMPRNGCQVAP